MKQRQLNYQIRSETDHHVSYRISGHVEWGCNIIPGLLWSLLLKADEIVNSVGGNTRN